MTMNSLKKLVLGSALVIGITGCGKDLEGKTNSIAQNFTETYSSNGEEVLADYSETEAVVDLEGDGKSDFIINSKNRIVCMREGLNIKEYNYFGDKYSSDKETEIISKAYQREFDSLLNQENKKINLKDLYKKEEFVRENQNKSKLNNPSGIYRESEKTVYVDIHTNLGRKIVDIDGDGQAEIMISTLHSDNHKLVARREGFNIKTYEGEGEKWNLDYGVKSLKIFSQMDQYKADKILASTRMEVYELTKNRRFHFIYRFKNTKEFKEALKNIKINGKEMEPTRKTSISTYKRPLIKMEHIIDIDGDGSVDFSVIPLDNSDNLIMARKEGFFIKSFTDNKKRINKDGSSVEKYFSNADTEIWNKDDQRRIDEIFKRVAESW
jgi:hypothetical protein